MDPYEAEILEYVGNADTSIAPTLTLEQGKSLLAGLGQVHPDLAEPRELSDARSTCYDILQSEGGDLLSRTRERFGNGNDRVLDDAQAAQIIEIVRSNGFCEAGVTP